MALIEVVDLVKTYRVRQRVAGPFALLRTLFRPRYDVVRAVDGVSFEVDAGECVGYLGPNGAGKSTTIKILTGVLVPTDGSVRVNGLTPWRRRHANARNIGVVFGQRTQLFWDLPLLDTLEALRWVYEIPCGDYQENLRLFKSLLGLDAFLHVPVRQLSLGQRMRGELAASLLHNPRILYLDEPTIGLDFEARERILDFVGEINRSRGVTLILTTHHLAEVERLCPRILLIDRGRILYDGSVLHFKEEYAPYRTLVLHLDRLEPVSGVEGASVVRQEGRSVVLRVPRGTAPTHRVIQALATRYSIADLSVTQPSLEDVVAGFYRSQLPSAPAGEASRLTAP